MMQRSARAARGGFRHYPFIVGIALLCAGTAAALVPAHAAPGQEAPVPAAVARSPVRNGAVPTLDRRLQAMTRELGLDSGQQAKIRQTLESQRSAVRMIWVNPAVPPAERAAATQAQTERTGDDIRAVLNDDQRKIYNRSRNDNQLPTGDKRSVEQWMDAAQARRPGPTGDGGAAEGTDSIAQRYTNGARKVAAQE